MPLRGDKFAMKDTTDVPSMHQFKSVLAMLKMNVVFSWRPTLTSYPRRIWAATWMRPWGWPWREISITSTWVSKLSFYIALKFDFSCFQFLRTFTFSFSQRFEFSENSYLSPVYTERKMFFSCHSLSLLYDISRSVSNNKMALP